MSDFLDIKDEIINGEPKYNIVDKNGNTINENVFIDLANDVIESGTELNKENLSIIQQTSRGLIKKFKKEDVMNSLKEDKYNAGKVLTYNYENNTIQSTPLNYVEKLSPGMLGSGQVVVDNGTNKYLVSFSASANSSGSTKGWVNLLIQKLDTFEEVVNKRLYSSTSYGCGFLKCFAIPSKNKVCLVFKSGSLPTRPFISVIDINEGSTFGSYITKQISTSFLNASTNRTAIDACDDNGNILLIASGVDYDSLTYSGTPIINRYDDNLNFINSASFSTGSWKAYTSYWQNGELAFVDSIDNERILFCPTYAGGINTTGEETKCAILKKEDFSVLGSISTAMYPEKKLITEDGVHKYYGSGKIYSVVDNSLLLEEDIGFTGELIQEKDYNLIVSSTNFVLIDRKGRRYSLTGASTTDGKDTYFTYISGTLYVVIFNHLYEIHTVDDITLELVDTGVITKQISSSLSLNTSYASEEITVYDNSKVEVSGNCIITREFENEIEVCVDGYAIIPNHNFSYGSKLGSTNMIVISENQVYVKGEWV